MKSSELKKGVPYASRAWIGTRSVLGRTAAPLGSYGRWLRYKTDKGSVGQANAAYFAKNAIDASATQGRDEARVVVTKGELDRYKKIERAAKTLLKLASLHDAFPAVKRLREALK